MDLKVYGGWPIRLQQISVNLRMDDRAPTAQEVIDLKQAGVVFGEVLEYAQHMKDQLRAHDEMTKMVDSFAGIVGEGAQYVPEEHAREYSSREDKSVWPHDPETWSTGTLGASEPLKKAYSHTAFSKLTERVQNLEAQMTQLRGKVPGLGY